MAAPMDVVFSFDTTGSMSQVLDEVKCRLNDLIQRLQADIPQFKVGVIAHGDYCDKQEFYDIRTLDLTDNLPDVVSFVSETTGTGGGDIPECYELALRHGRNMSWRAGSRRVFVVIGDAYPHGPDYAQNTLNIDWQEELSNLVQKNVTVYGVQYGQDPESVSFFQRLSGQSGGQHLRLQDMGDICHAIMAICYREQGPDMLQNYEAEVRADNAARSLKTGLESMFNTLGESQVPAMDDDLDLDLDAVPPLLSTVSSFCSVRSADTAILNKDDNNNGMNGICKDHSRSLASLKVDTNRFTSDIVNGAGSCDNKDQDKEVTETDVTNNALKRKSEDDWNTNSVDCSLAKKAKLDDDAKKPNFDDDDSSFSSWDDTLGSFRIIRPPLCARKLHRSTDANKGRRRGIKTWRRNKTSPKAKQNSSLKTKRHGASDKHFKFNNLLWSKWHLAAAKNVPEDSGSWKKVAQRGCDDALWRKDLLRLVETKMVNTLRSVNLSKRLRSRFVPCALGSTKFTNNTEFSGALFELGIIPRGSRNIQTVWLHATNTRGDNRPLIPKMLRKPWYSGLCRPVKEPLTAAVQAGSKVFLRWACVPNVQKVKREILTQYDYLWR